MRTKLILLLALTAACKSRSESRDGPSPAVMTTADAPAATTTAMTADAPATTMTTTMTTADAPAAVQSRVAVSFDEHMGQHLAWRGAGGPGVIAFDPAVQPGIRVGGSELTDFALDRARTAVRRVVDPELGPGEETLATGLAVGPDGLRVVRETRVLLPDRQPDVAVLRTSFRNGGDAAFDIDEVWATRLLLDRKQAEPAEAPHAFASYQGGAYAWGKDYTVIPLMPGFRQSNFQGQEDLGGSEGVGGGMPLVDVWGRAMGVAVALLEPGPRWVSLPVAVRPDGRVEVGLREAPRARLGQKQRLGPGESFATVTAAVILHRGDYFEALARYGDLLRARGVAIPRESPASAHEPYWKSWGFRKDFTVDRFLALLPELSAMGIRTANLDDGWYDFAGDWQPNRAAGKFPGGAADVVRFVERVHGAGFRTAIWWYPLGASPQSRLARERRDLLVMDESGQPSKDIDGLLQLCPGHEPARRHIRDTLRRMVADWGFDGVYLDFQGLSAVPACFNPAHHHRTPLDGFEALPRVFEDIARDVRALRPDPFLEACVCALPHSPYIMPFFTLATTSDPRSDVQARRRLKAEKAIRGPRFAVGDGYQVPADEWRGTSLREGFASALGTGAGLTTFYADLDPRQQALWRRWFTHYRNLGLGAGEYLNLYDIAFDRPEGHVVRRGADLYYGFFADRWPASDRIELRGLQPGRRYRVLDYVNDKDLGEIAADAPFLNAAIEGSLLLRVRPVD